MASADYLLKIEGITGESVTEGFTEQMQLQSWSWGTTNSGSAAQGQGMGVGKATPSDFHFVIQNGQASVQLALAVWKGNHIPEAILTCRKTTSAGTPEPYYVITFTDLVISSHQEGGSDGSDILPMVQISFNYAKVNAKYFKQGTQGGALEQSNNVTYDVKLVKAEGA